MRLLFTFVVCCVFLIFGDQLYHWIQMRAPSFISFALAAPLIYVSISVIAGLFCVYFPFPSEAKDNSAEDISETPNYNAGVPVNYINKTMNLVFTHVSESLPETEQTVLCVINLKGGGISIVTARYKPESKSFFQKYVNISNKVAFWTPIDEAMCPTIC